MTWKVIIYIITRYLNTISNKDIMQKEFFSGFMKIHILHHAAEGEICGVDIAEELATHGYRVSPGFLYPTLHKLEDMGFLKHEERVVKGRRRKYYRITPEGRSALDSAKEKIRELVDEVLGT